MNSTETLTLTHHTDWNLDDGEVPDVPIVSGFAHRGKILAVERAWLYVTRKPDRVSAEVKVFGHVRRANGEIGQNSTTQEWAFDSASDRLKYVARSWTEMPAWLAELIGPELDKQLDAVTVVFPDQHALVPVPGAVTA